MSGLQRISRKLQSMFFNLCATISEGLYTCRAAIAPLSSMLRSAARSAASMWREEHSTLTETYSDMCRTVAYSTTYERTYNLISSFGSLVMKTILIGFTCLSFMMVLIVSGASKLFEMIEAKCTMK